MIAPDELRDVLEERKQADRALDAWGNRDSMQRFQRDLADVYSLYGGDWDVVWPDQVRSSALPKIPNYVQLAADDRAHVVAATKPTIICRQGKPGDKARAAADKRERIYAAWWKMNRIAGHKTEMWAHDAMAGGLTVCRVMPDFTKPDYERFPEYRRLEPAFSYPDPLFSEGPYLDSFLYAYECKRRVAEKRYGVSLADFVQDPQTDSTTVNIIEFYDDEWVTIVAEGINSKSGGTTGKRRTQLILAERHMLECCPVVIGARASMDGSYRGEFMGGMGVLNYANKLMTLTLDDAISRVYSAKTYFDIENPEDYGPDALLEMTSPQGQFNIISQPNAPFSNLQLLRSLEDSSRAATLFPQSRSGDPSQSIISAAGINATQGQFSQDVASIQTNILVPMLEAANHVAAKADVIWGGNIEKTITGSDVDMYEETYVPVKDIGDYTHTEIVFGLGAGMDPINTNVVVLQQKGAGLLSNRTAMEQSPFVEDPQREEKQLLLESLDASILAGLLAKAQDPNNPLDPALLALIRKGAEKDGTSLADIVAQTMPGQQAPLAAPGQPGAQGASLTPGIAGAAQGSALPENAPPLRQLLGRTQVFAHPPAAGR